MLPSKFNYYRDQFRILESNILDIITHILERIFKRYLDELSIQDAETTEEYTFTFKWSNTTYN